MFGTVTAIIVLYAIGLLVGRRYDKKDREKVSDFVYAEVDDGTCCIGPRFSSISHTSIMFWPSCLFGSI